MMAYMRECHGDWLAVQHGTVLARFSLVDLLLLLLFVAIGLLYVDIWMLLANVFLFFLLILGCFC
jgi:hypothetical protein